jgi:AcrR family transcriptional regulator
MSEPVKRVPRAYNSERRRQAAEQTRQRILDAARTRFVERGYAGTTIAAIAEEASTAAETVYATFKSKTALLEALVRGAVRGKDDTEVLQQPGPRRLEAETDQRAQLRVFAADVSERLARTAPLLAVVASAAASEPSLAALYGDLHGARMRNLSSIPPALARNGPLRVDPERAAQTIWALASPELYALLTGQRGWSRERYAGWLADTLEAVLLDDA